ncbi:MULTISPECIES: DUF3717 domain-containing protein [Burkholderia cepacia complex]|uniref:DUF3717 domain-containing protein n=1 Tax=Burkholderia cepacia TaxID=292 RepID=A0AAX2RAB9_BURCE|nr:MULTISPECIES: DUF3717 domain-containing protein [Burkholderia cepacia complex]TES96125.1 DUF3717 domain-containing protein [Burkholderia cepacia]TEU31685.1 DUF3717 domain-containing protein [Burkholderia cepacia]TEU32666.1 DUF3717 domain-containing protein [Burkholderia cepacia]TEU90409.1 DUF3717 domain-containing protein [Burkholderia cepacia]TEU99543.1 DUF3717 domain-containing protein [Burkholderia cepacia]
MPAKVSTVTIEHVETTINSLKAKRRFVAVDIAIEMKLATLGELYGQMLCEHTTAVDLRDLTEEQRRLLTEAA